MWLFRAWRGLSISTTQWILEVVALPPELHGTLFLEAEPEGCANEPEVVAAFKAASDHPGVLLPWASVQSFKSIDPRNPRLRELIRDTVDCGAWQAFWMPPSVPYYNLTGAFADLAMARFTKRLVFSSWQVVPKAIAMLVSYEAERRMITSHDYWLGIPRRHKGEATPVELCQF